MVAVGGQVKDRLMFAVDYPYADCVQQTVQAADINLKNADKFYHLNAKRVFGIDIPGVVADSHL